MVNTRKSSLRLLGSKSPGPGPGPGAGAEPGATGGSSHFISSRTRSSKTRAASCPAAKAGGSGGASVTLDEARVRARRPESRGSEVPARLPRLCLAGLGAGSLQWRLLGRLETGSAGAVEGGTQEKGRDAVPFAFQAGPALLCKEQPMSPGERALGVPFGVIRKICCPCPCPAPEGNSSGEARAKG